MKWLKYLYGCCVLLGIVGAYLVDDRGTGRFTEAYPRLQGSIFTGLLTVASFLLSLKAFILIRMRHDVLDTTTYQNHVKAITGGSLDNLYLPLRNLSTLLIWTVASSLAGSASQLTLAFLWKPYGTYLAAGLASGAIFLVVACWLGLSKNVRAWIEAVEREHKLKK